MTYLFIIIILILLTYHYDFKKNKSHRLEWYALMCIIFILVAGLRYRMGFDTPAYEYAYKNFPSISALTEYDFSYSRYNPGFIILGSIAKSISNEFFVLQLIHATLINTVVFIFFKNNSSNIFFCILLYFLTLYFYFNMEIMRESCAIVIFLISWKYFVKHKWIPYYLINSISLIFHTSAIILFLLPVLYWTPIRIFLQIDRLFILKLMIYIFIFYILSSKFFEILRLFEIAEVDDYANTYENSDIYGERNNFNIIGIIFYLVTISIPYLIYQLNKKKLKYENNFQIISFILGLYIIIVTAGLFITILTRFYNYFTIFVILYLSKIIDSKFKFKIEKFKFNLNYLFSFSITAIYLLTSFYSLYYIDLRESGVPKLYNYYPYNSVIFKEKNKLREINISRRYNWDN